MVVKTTSRRQGSGLSNATMIPPMIAEANLIHSENDLSLKPGYAVGDCHARSGPNQDKLVYPMLHRVPETTCWGEGSELSNAT